uniref:Uncharacterized protein n=1 Tax=Amblyomma triste TaxID=251400 RepID=A0A023GD73_AMBTT
MAASSETGGTFPTNSAKKARVFDLNAIFEEARKTAISRSKDAILIQDPKSCISDPESNVEDEAPCDSNSTSSVTQSNEDGERPVGSPDTSTAVVNSKKKARVFDLNAIFEEARKTAVSRSKDARLAEDSKPSTSDPKSNIEDEASGGCSSASAVTHREEASDEELVGPPITLSTETNTVTEGSDEELVGPPITLSAEANEGASSEEEDEEEGERTTKAYRTIPVKEQLTLRHGTKIVSALALDPNGARLVTGGYDFDITLFDFAGMDSSLQPFRSLRPCECHQIRNLEYSCTGDTFLVVSGSAQAKVLDRDGFEVMECIKGNQYITDMARTKGHVAMLNYGCWHPRSREDFLTCANDGTLRLWNVDKPNGHKALVKTKQQGGLRAIPSTCRFSRDGQLLVAGCQDGSLQFWDQRRTLVHPSSTVREAHKRGADVSCVAFAHDGRQLATRSCDDTLKLWDLRALRATALHTFKELDNLYPATDCGFSPDDRVMYTATSNANGEGQLVFFERDTTHEVLRLQLPSPVARIMWHARLNQLLVGLASGEVRLLYDTAHSHHGALLCASKAARARPTPQGLTQAQVLTPHALPLFREERPRSSRKRLEKARKDPVLSQRPDLPVTGPGQGGRIASAGNTLSSYIVRNLGTTKRVDDNVDPREAILKYAKEAAENPYWVTPAYASTQPKPVFQESEEPTPAKKPKQS